MGSPSGFSWACFRTPFPAALPMPCLPGCPYSVRAATHCLRRTWPTAWTLRVCAVLRGSARIPYEPHTASGVRGGLLGPSGSALSAPPSPLQGLARILWPVLRTSLALPPACVADCLDPPGLRRLSPLPGPVPAAVSHRQRLLPCLFALVRHVCSAHAVWLLAFMARLRSRSLAPLCRFP